MIKRSFLHLVQPFVDGVIVRAPRGWPMDSAGLAETPKRARRAVHLLVARRRHPIAIMRCAVKGNSCRWRGARIFQRTYSSGTVTALEKIWHRFGSIEND